MAVVVDNFPKDRQLGIEGQSISQVVMVPSGSECCAHHIRTMSLNHEYSFSNTNSCAPDAPEKALKFTGRDQLLFNRLLQLLTHWFSSSVRVVKLYCNKRSIGHYTPSQKLSSITFHFCRIFLCRIGWTIAIVVSGFLTKRWLRFRLERIQLKEKRKLVGASVNFVGFDWPAFDTLKLLPKRC